MRIQVIIACLLLNSTLGLAQSEDNQVEEIRIWYAEIEASISKCIKVEIDAWVDEDNYGSGTTTLTGFYDASTGQFVKIIEYNSGDWMEEWNNYYFRNDKLFFIFSSGYSASEYYTAEEMGVDEDTYFENGMEAKTLAAFEYRKYFANETCIRYLTKYKVFPADDPVRKMRDIDNEVGDTSEVQYYYYAQHGAKMIASLSQKMKE